MELIAVITTTASMEEAKAIAEGLVLRKLSACVQISQIESFFTWKGKLGQDREYRIVIKTTAERYDEVEKAVKEMHSYELPAIYAVPVTHVYEPYGEWVTDNSQS
ncbi:MAG TPA: divalent-cation tolerance protein CutA [Firmicutes bacterium]|jgi:periplasmic divalent cation tolerance protein|nr:MAG: cytochrome C biogenesis protein [Peptococcaceae bacterium 1109]HHT74204.1 divalent-cation tolerance protein CutA [Bacillota bacterium]